MKKSHYFFNTGESVLKDLDTQSNASVTSSIPSIKFSEKYKHHKKRPTMPLYKPPNLATAKKEGFSLEDFELLREIGSGKYGKVHVARYIFLTQTPKNRFHLCPKTSVKEDNKRRKP